MLFVERPFTVRMSSRHSKWDQVPVAEELHREQSLLEVGMTFFPFPKTDFGFTIAAYYIYATNQNKSLDINGLNNVGFKLGIAF